MNSTLFSPVRRHARTLKSRLGVAGKSEDGFTAVEFALVIIPFLAILFAIIEVALVYFATFSLENATEQAARLIRTGQAQGGTFSAADFKQEVCDRIPIFLNCDSNLFVDVRSFATFAAAAAGAPEPVDGDGNMVENFQLYQAGNGGTIVLVSVYYKWDLIAELPTFSTGLGLGNLADGSRLISAATAFKNEPFDN